MIASQYVYNIVFARLVSIIGWFEHVSQDKIMLSTSFHWAIVPISLSPSVYLSHTLSIYQGVYLTCSLSLSHRLTDWMTKPRVANQTYHLYTIITSLLCGDDMSLLCGMWSILSLVVISINRGYYHSNSHRYSIDYGCWFTITLVNA